MTSIFGTSGFFDSDKVQNQQAIANYTNFTGTLANNGSPIYATGGPFLPLTGGNMTGAINMGGQEVKNCGAYRITTGGTNVIIGDTSTATSSTDNVLIGKNATIIDASCGNSVVIGKDASIGTSSNSVALGFFASTGGSNNCVAIGPHAGATGGLDSVVIGNTSISNTTQAHCIGKSLINSTLGSLLVDCSANIRSNATTCDLGTTAKPFQNLLLNGYALTSSVSKSIPCVRCTYSDTAIGFGSTTTETSVIDGTLSGSLTIPATTAAGFTMHMRAAWLYTAGVVTTFTIRFKVGGTTMLTTTIPAGVVTNQFIWAEHIVQLRSPSNRLFVSCRISRDAGATVISSNITDSIWNPASSNAITVTGQFSDTNGTWRGDSFSLDSSYAS